LKERVKEAEDLIENERNIEGVDENS